MWGIRVFVDDSLPENDWYIRVGRNVACEIEKYVNKNINKKSFKKKGDGNECKKSKKNIEK